MGLKDETFTPAEASAFSMVPVRRVHKELEHRIIEVATTPPRLTFSALVYLQALELIDLDLPVNVRAQIYRGVVEAVRSAAVSIRLTRLLTLDVKPVVDELEDKVTRFQRWKRKLVISDEIIPETHRRGYETVATFSLLGGFVVMMFLDTVFA